MTLIDFNAHHKIQAISYDKLFICWKSFLKALLSQKNRRIYLNILLVNYFHKLYLISSCSSCISVCYGITYISVWLGILRLEGWKYFTGKASFLTSFSHLSALFWNTFKNVGSFTELLKLEITIKIFWKYSDSVSAHILRKRKLFTVPDLINSLVILRNIEGLIFCLSLLSSKSHEKFMEFILLNFVANPDIPQAGFELAQNLPSQHLLA